MADAACLDADPDLAAAGPRRSRSTSSSLAGTCDLDDA